ncbi:MAG: zinc-dependent metalloprotease [Acidimicrobiales bacterium]
MSTPEQPGGDNPFAGLPFFGDLMRMMNSQGGSPWDAATQLAVSIATNGVSEPNVDPAARIELEEFSRIAEMHVEEVTGLTLHPGGRPLRVVPVTRGQWAQQALRDHRPLFERLSGSLGQASTGSFGADADAPGADPMTAMFGGIMKMMAPLMLGMTAGSMVGHLAEKAMGTYHLPLVRPEGADVQLVAPNIDAFATEWEIDGRDLRMWVCLSELVHHAVLSIPHVRTRFGALLDEFLGGFRTDPAALEDALGGSTRCRPWAIRRACRSCSGIRRRCSG